MLFRSNCPVVVSALLARAAADPTRPNQDGKTPFELAGDRATRDAFRVARSEIGETRWDWDVARVPPALTKAQAEARERRERAEADTEERLRREKEMARLQASSSSSSRSQSRGAKAAGLSLGSGGVHTTLGRLEEESRGLTPEAKMRLERERRARAAEERIKRMQSRG